MGFCGIKIPGHSEAAFKNKKVFAKRRKRLEDKMNFNNVKIESREKYAAHNWFRYLKIGIVLGFFCTILILTYAFISRVDNLLISTTNMKSIERSENKEAAVLMYNSSKLHLNAGNLNYAQDEITRVLKLYPTNIEALELMHKILDRQCKDNNMYCDHAKDYKEYLTLQLQ